MAEKIVVTGGAGFIGSTLVEALLEKGGFEITVLDNFSTGKRKNLEKASGKVKVAEGDICSYQETVKAIAGAKTVFHMAAFSYVGESIREPAKYNRENIDGTLNVLKAAHENSAERVVFPSSCIVYGKTGKTPIPETEPLNPNTPYGLTKLAGEFYCKFFTEVHGLETVCLRIFNAYGPRMQNRVLSIFADLILQGKSPKVSGDGTQARDFVFVEDIADGLVKAMEAGRNASGKSFNIGTGAGTNLNELIEKINESLGTSVEPEHVEVAAGEIDEIIADTRLSKEVLGFTARHSLDQGLEKTISWLKEKQGQ